MKHKDKNTLQSLIGLYPSSPFRWPVSGNISSMQVKFILELHPWDSKINKGLQFGILESTKKFLPFPLQSHSHILRDYKFEDPTLLPPSLHLYRSHSWKSTGAEKQASSGNSALLHFRNLMQGPLLSKPDEDIHRLKSQTPTGQTGKVDGLRRRTWVSRE